MTYEEKDAYNAAMIGVPLGRVSKTQRRIASETTSRNFIVEEVRVLSSVFYGSGTIVRVLIPDARRDFDPPYPGLPMGRKLLFVACRPLQGNLIWPLPGGTVIQERLKIPVESPVEVLGLAAFETNQALLPPGKNPVWRFAFALGEAVRGSSTANLESILDYVQRIHPPDLTWMQAVGPHERDAYSEAFDKGVRGETPYHKALVYYVLNRKYYWGYGDMYLAAVREAAQDPLAFPRGVPSPSSYWEDPLISESIPRWFKHDPFDPVATADVIVRSKNSRISAFLIRTFGGTPSAEIQKSLSVRLDDPEPEVRWELTKKYAAWQGMPERAPLPFQLERLPDAPRMSKRIYPSLDETVAFWKTKFGRG